MAMEATKVCDFLLLCFVFNLAHAAVPALPRAYVAAAETAGQWFAAVAPTRHSHSSGQPTSSSDANPSGCVAYSSDRITSGRPASSSGATNSYIPVGLFLRSDHLLAPPV